MSDRALILCGAVLFPLICALSIFIIQKKSTQKRKLLTFLIGLPLFEVPCILLVTDFPDLFQSIVGEEHLGAIPTEVALGLTIALGIAYLGISTAVCGERILKTHGILFLSLDTLLFLIAEFLLSYFTLLGATGEDSSPALSDILPSLTDSVLGGWKVRFLLLLCFGIFLCCFFLCFLALRRKSDLQTEDIIRMHREEEKEKRIELEGVCAVCRHAVPKDGDSNSVICDYKGERDGDARCARFEYDPLKRDPELFRTDKKTTQK